MSNTPSNLPTLQELQIDPVLAFKNDQFKLLLNQPAIDKWLKKHPMAKKKNEAGETVKAEYLPIDKIEFLLDRIFQNWYPEVLREGTMFNSVYVTVRVHMKNPVTGEWFFIDGVGASPVQTDAGTGAENMAKNIKPAAIQMALPAAKSYAIKDACEHLGDLFGRNINRAGSIEFSGAYSETPPESKVDKADVRMMDMIASAKDKKSLEKLKSDLVTNEQRVAYDEKWKTLT